MVVLFNKQSVSWNFRSSLFCRVPQIKVRVLEGSTVWNASLINILKCLIDIVKMQKGFCESQVLVIWYKISSALVQKQQKSMESFHHDRKTSACVVYAFERCKQIHAGCGADPFLVSPGLLACDPLTEHLIQLFVSAQRQKHLYTSVCSIFVIVCSCKCSYLSCQ